MGNIHVFGPVVQEMLFFLEFFLALMSILFSRAEWFNCAILVESIQFWRPFCSAQHNQLCNFGRGHYSGIIPVKVS